MELSVEARKTVTHRIQNAITLLGGVQCGYEGQPGGALARAVESLHQAIEMIHGDRAAGRGGVRDGFSWCKGDSA